MRILLKNGFVVNVFTGEVERTEVLLSEDKIIGVGDYTENDADLVEDVTGKYICPGFIDGHLHIESTMLLPQELARVCLPHGTTTVVADPHEIANVSGQRGIEFMLAASENIPLTVYYALPSCVPATAFDEAGATLDAEALRPLYSHRRVIALGEMMNYPGVIAGDKEVLRKIEEAQKLGKTVNGHAPLLRGKALDKYLAAGINDDHECSDVEEAMEKIRKGQWIMIRQGTAAKDLQALLPLFEEPFASRCLLVSDDHHPADLLRKGHIDSIIREAVEAGKSAVTGIRMATLGAAQCFGLKRLGAIAPGYTADILVLRDLEGVEVETVYRHGVKVAEKGKAMDFAAPAIPAAVEEAVKHSFHLCPLREADFYVKQGKGSCRVIKTVPHRLLTEEWVTEIDTERNGGIDVERDILKLAVIERHRNTGHVGLGFVSGIGMKRGALAASVSHDSHNLIVIGTNERDMVIAANRVRELQGGSTVVAEGEILAEMPLPVAGLMTDLPAVEIARQNEELRRSVHDLGVPPHIEPFMTVAFLSLPVIPHLKMSTLGLVDVDRQMRVSLFV